MDIKPLGDSALLVRVRERVDDAPEAALEEVLAVLRRLESAEIPGVIEWAPAYTAVAAFYNPVVAMAAGAPPDGVFEWLARRIRKHLAGCENTRASRALRRIEIPVCYAGDYGPDLEDVARHSGLSAEEVMLRHSAGDYYVHCLGFIPGFPYLSGLAPELATPRRAVPRKDTPAGSVGIGGAQTGVYPLRSPGGWNLIGRTPRRLFSAKTAPPALLQPGDRIRFRPITREEFAAWTE